MHEQLLFKENVINHKTKISNYEKTVVRKTLQFPENLLASKEVFRYLIEYYVIYKNVLQRTGLQNWMNYTNSFLSNPNFT